MTEKALEDYNDVFSDIVNVLLFNGNEKLKEDGLEQATARSVYNADNKLREQERVIAKYWKKHNICISYFGIENETVSEDDMPFRIIGYDGTAYRDQISYETDENGKRKLNDNPRYPVVTLVLYFGLKRWNKPKTLHEALGDNLDDDMRPFVHDYPINLFEIAFLSDEQVEMFKSDFKIVADYFVQMRKNKEYVPTQTQFRHVREVLQLMSILTNDRRFEEAVNDIENSGRGAEPKNMCEVLDRVEKRGIEIGESRGDIKRAKADAMRMKKDGVPLDKIALYVNIDINTAKQWTEQDDNNDI